MMYSLALNYNLINVFTKIQIKSVNSNIFLRKKNTIKSRCVFSVRTQEVDLLNILF